MLRFVVCTSRLVSKFICMLFFELLQVAVSQRDRLTYAPSLSEWQHLYQLAGQHAVLGVCYMAVQRLPREQWPNEELLMDWVWQVQRIKERNDLLSHLSAEVSDRLKTDGFDVCLLKGQGNALMYGNMADCRQAGDIDLWVVPHDEPRRQPKQRVIEYVRQRYRNVRLRYHHIDLPCYGETDVEIHFMPSYLNNFRLNRRLEEWCWGQCDAQMQHQVEMGGGTLAVPTAGFNVIFQLLHIYKHVFEEGLGLRQMMDYYFALRQFETRSSEQERQQFLEMICRLKLEPLAGAVMYVMQDVFGMSPDQLPFPADRGEGVALLSDIVQSGNFGHYDTRYDKEPTAIGARAQIHRYWRKTKRNLMLVFHFPHEAGWEPIFRLFHFFWRTFNLWKI